MFSIEERDRVRDYVLQLAQDDRRVTAGAVVGSLALSAGDKWSDLDLTFGVADKFSIYAVLEDWTLLIEQEFNAVQLFDLPSGPSIYRVFLLPGCLQFDLSFTPASQFGARGPKFRLLFGEATQQSFPKPPRAENLFGYAVHHALRARFCIERGRLWQAEYWISSLRDYALSLACLQHGLVTAQGRGYDELPVEVRDKFIGALVASLDRTELRRALTCAIEGLLNVTEQVQELADKVEPELRVLTSEW